MADSTPHPQLRRELGVTGAVFMGLGSIVGTGVFVSIGIAAGITGPSVVLAVMIAALVATANGLSSAQLAAAHPVSGGTYEYGYEFLTPALGFSAGWMFLLAKSASAATAALGFAGYSLDLVGAEPDLLVPVGLGAVVVLTVIVLAGIRSSNTVNIIVVSVTLLALAAFVVLGFPHVERINFSGFVGDGGAPGFLEATALMFVAYTGYGRIATLGEEVRDPKRTIPKAIITTLLATMVLYAAVALVAVGAAGADTLAELTEELAAPLEELAKQFAGDGLALFVAIGAITAMLGVLLNLILGLSRVLLAMGRRGDMPSATARIDASGSTPLVAVPVMGAVIAALVLIGDVRTTWTFSAFTVLLYYSLTNLAALRLPPDARLFPGWVSMAGLAACFFLAFWVEPVVWAVGLGLLAVGFGVRAVVRRTGSRA
ncbi:MAG TPA: amino acid permease [Acidimicrobiia bacterium]|jgi:APA family basic amino acid/polyamine antiporter|nr:amino acid permease [Acidimicrobiia bacterium]